MCQIGSTAVTAKQLTANETRCLPPKESPGVREGLKVKRIIVIVKMQRDDEGFRIDLGHKHEGERRLLKVPRSRRSSCVKKRRILIGLMTSDSKLKASRNVSK